MVNKQEMFVSVIIPTRNRSQIIGQCLQYVFQQDYSAFEVILVDTSTNHTTREIVERDYPQVKYLFLENGAGRRPESKNLGIQHAQGEILAFIDDDSFVQEHWLRECVNGYSSAEVGGVGGFIVDENAENAEAIQYNSIGTVTYNGVRVGNFHRDPGKIVEVDHIRGCNMSFRKNAVEQVNGFDPNYTGSNVGEETDLSVRVKKAGYKILFNPKMKVIHTTAPRDIVQRNTFDYRRQYYIARNSTYLMFMNYDLKRTLAYIFTNNTGIVAFIKQPSLRKLFCVLISGWGKCVGCFVSWYVFLRRSVFGLKDKGLRVR